MQRAVSVAVIAAMCWLLFGAHDASWARQQPAAVEREIADKVRLVSPGTEIKVFLTGRRVLEGRLREVQDDAIVVDHKKGGGSTRVLLTEIERLQTKKGRSAVSYVLIGTVVAVGVLLVLAISTCDVSTATQRRG